MKEVDAQESTVKFYQVVYDDSGKLREVHHKFPVDLARVRSGLGRLRKLSFAAGYQTKVDVVQST